MNITDAQLADYFGVSPTLLPFLPELLIDFFELGSDPDLAVTWLEGHGVGPGSRVLDLGCGKGAATITVAKKLGAHVDGVDAFAPFIAEARTLAQRHHVQGLCTFRRGDLRHAAQEATGYDAVLYLSVGALGALSQAVAALRACVNPGGCMMVDEAYRNGPPIEFPGYRDLADRAETYAALTRFGDEIVKEKIHPVSEVKSQNQRYQSAIEQRGRALALSKPELAEHIEAYVEKERQECAILERDVICATWLLKRP